LINFFLANEYFRSVNSWKCKCLLIAKTMSDKSDEIC